MVIVVQSGDSNFRIIGPFIDANAAVAFAMQQQGGWLGSWEVRPLEAAKPQKAQR